MRAERATAREWLTTANALSFSRVPLAIAFLLSHSNPAQIAILAAAALSDFLDGWVARRQKQTSRIGALVDPITDKIFLVTALISLAAHGAVSTRGLAVLLAR